MSSTIPWNTYEPGQVETLISAWLTRTVPGAQRVNGAGGDDGADVRAPLNGGLWIFEIKSFHQRLTAGQKRKIANSLATAVQRQPAMVRWTLVLPRDPSPAEITWFEQTLAATTTVPIDYIGQTALEAGLNALPDLLRAFAPGSVERRALDLLAQQQLEHGSMPRGMIDGLERAHRLRDQFDLTDPDYAFDLTELAPGRATIRVRPKDPQVPSRRPLGGQLSLRVAPGSGLDQAIGEFMRYGRPVTIPSENVAALQLDLPGGLAGLLPPDAQPEVSLQQTTATPGWRQTGRLIATRGGRVLATLPIDWDDSSRGPLGGHWLGGRDRSGFLAIAMQVDPDARGGLSIRAPASDDVLPSEAVPVLRFLTVLSEAEQIRLEAHGHPPVETRVTGDISGGIQVPATALVVTEALARVQQATGDSFPLPPEWSRRDSEQLYFCDQILQNGIVQWYWPGAVIPVAAKSAANLLAQAPLPRLAVSGSSRPRPTVALFGHAVTLPGVLRMEVTDAVVSNGPDLASTVRAVPGWTAFPLHVVADETTSCVFFLDPVVETSPDSSSETGDLAA